ncbi:OmpH family outer membrane protein [Marixanthomonas ophiurae]|uniref:OmpH family outer membrane protein n=1 Tax=Marixanthomonas ophiurae TaxID=387659 RepID=A0A3E1Q7R4_9FLAO|nr:OmpH family outer membrane protein [Marixanthomonas ophiurae]RFN58160.1 OmpH family outer membrane protein [Marixanthomonas ophiurae]
MRNTKMRAIILVLGLTLYLPNIIKAQNSIAKINMNQLFEEHPEKAEYINELNELKNEYQQDIEEMTNELVKTINKYDDEADLQSNETNAQRVKEIQGERDKINKYREDALEDVRDQETYINKKISDDIRSAVSNVAKKQNLDFVIDSSSEYNIINADCKNIVNDVKEELIKVAAERNKRTKDILGGW